MQRPILPHDQNAKLSRLITCFDLASINQSLHGRIILDSSGRIDLGRMLADIAPFEKRIDLHIDLLCRDEFRDAECVNDIQKKAIIVFDSRSNTDDLGP